MTELEHLHEALETARHYQRDERSPADMVTVDHWDEKQNDWIAVGRYHRYFAEGLLTAYCVKLNPHRRIV